MARRGAPWCGGGQPGWQAGRGGAATPGRVVGAAGGAEEQPAQCNASFQGSPRGAAVAAAAAAVAAAGGARSHRQASRPANGRRARRAAHAQCARLLRQPDSNRAEPPNSYRAARWGPDPTRSSLRIWPSSSVAPQSSSRPTRCAAHCLY